MIKTAGGGTAFIGRRGHTVVDTANMGGYTMALLGSIPKVDSLGDFSGRFELGCRLLERGAHADAYLLFSALQGEQERHPAVLFNLCLCHVAAGEWEPCPKLLEQALGALKKNLVSGTPKNATYRALMERQAAGRGYLFPLPESAPALAPEYARECVLRLLVDACAALGMWEQVRRLAAQLEPKGYVNVTKALALAEGKA